MRERAHTKRAAARFLKLLKSKKSRGVVVCKFKKMSAFYVNFVSVCTSLFTYCKTPALLSDSNLLFSCAPLPLCARSFVFERLEKNQKLFFRAFSNNKAHSSRREAISILKVKLAPNGFSQEKLLVDVYI